MYSYAVSSEARGAREVYVFVVDSVSYPLRSYIVKVEVAEGRIRKASCSCPGFAVRGKCLHLSLTLRKLQVVRGLKLNATAQPAHVDVKREGREPERFGDRRERMNYFDDVVDRQAVLDR